MADRPASPFANLGRPAVPTDKAVARSTQDRTRARVAPAATDPPDTTPPVEIGDAPPEARTQDRPPVSSYGSAYGRTGGRRTITRYAFEFYQDQLEELRRISLDDKYRGERGSMSEMVREALDQYLHTRRGGRS